MKKSYLVMYCGLEDDVPVLLTDDKAEATSVGGELSGYYHGADDDQDQGHHPLVREALEAREFDLGTFVCIGVLSFLDGKPVMWDTFADDVSDSE